jgi:predicted nuclease of predicted toxin-antitoxin system
VRPELKLLFDQNLPAKFENIFGDLFPGSMHVKSIGLATADDRSIWDYAKENGFAIISKDSDFHHLSFLLGAPPKTVWLRCGNCSVQDLQGVIRSRSSDIVAFLHDTDGALLVIT